MAHTVLTLRPHKAKTFFSSRRSRSCGKRMQRRNAENFPCGNVCPYKPKLNMKWIKNIFAGFQTAYFKERRIMQSGFFNFLRLLQIFIWENAPCLKI